MSTKTFAPEAYQENKYLEKFDFGSKKISQILLFPASFNSFLRITNIVRTKCCCFMTCTNLTLVPVFTGRTAFSSDAESCQLWTCIAFFHYYYYYIWYSFNVKFSSPCVLIFFLTLHQSLSHCHVQIVQEQFTPCFKDMNTISIVYRRDNNENNNNCI